MKHMDVIFVSVFFSLIFSAGVTKSGCPGEQWALIALKTYGDLDTGRKIDADICCHDESTN